HFARTGSHPLYIITYFLLIIGFAYFYNSIAFNPVDTADNMKKYGGFIPGIRPGRQTAEHLNYILTRITLPGAVFLGAVAILPFIALAAGNVQQFPFGGTSILITVGVGLETMKQIESQLLMRTYEGFLRGGWWSSARPGRARARRRSSWRSSSPAPTWPPGTSSGRTWPRGPSSAGPPRSTWTVATWCPTRSSSPWSWSGSPIGTARPGSSWTGSRAPSTR